MLGLSFWKVGSRTFYAVLEDQLPDETSHKGKRSLAVSEIRREFLKIQVMTVQTMMSLE